MSESNRIKRAGTASLWWGIGLVVAALLVVLFGNAIYYALAGGSVNSDVMGGVLAVATYLLTIIQGVGIPLGAVLIGVGIVLRVLAPRSAINALEGFDDDLEDDLEEIVEFDGSATEATEAD